MSGLRAAAGFFLGVFFLAPGHSPAAPTNALERITVGQAVTRREENRVVEAEGTVTFVGRLGQATYLEISSESGSMPVMMYHGTGYLTDLLLKSRVRVRGVCEAVYNVDEEQMAASLSAGTFRDITILQLPEETWRRYPLQAIGSLTGANFSAPIVRVRGIVQSVKAGQSFVIGDGTNQMEINLTGASPQTAGTDVEALCGWRENGRGRVFDCIFSRLSRAGSAASMPLLTKAAEIRWLKPEEAARKYPVKVRGVITYFRKDRLGGDVQDGTGGVWVWHARSRRGKLVPGVADLKPGDLCEVTGVTDAGDFSPQIIPSRFVVLGTAEFPEPAHPGWNELIHGALDAEWVEIEGVGMSVKHRTLSVRMKGGVIPCIASGPLDQYIGALVKVRGVVLVPHGPKRNAIGVRIMVPSRRFISMQSPAPADPFSAPAIRIGDLFRYNPDEYAFQRVKFFGQVVQQRAGVLYVMDGANGMRVIPKEETELRVGDTIEAVGFPEVDSPFDKPLLTVRDADVRRNGHEPLPGPVKISAANLLDRVHDSTRVQTEANLLGVNEYPGEQVLQLQTGAQVYRARINIRSGQMPPLRLGSRLELTGVYAIGSDRLVPFELLLNSPADIRVLELPSWWTASHAMFVAGGMAVLILLAIIWIGMLRRQVEKRTLQLSAANQSLTNEIAERRRAENELVQTRTQHLIEQERTRIARDLHDDLGSRVTQLVLLNELTLQNRVSPGGVMEHAREISTAARQMIQSLDETVWAVNPRNDTLPQLLDYLGSFAGEFLNTAGVRCRFDFPDHPPARPISAETRHNLFLAVKEALNNAVRHARATEVRLRAAISETSLVLAIEDDGCGFDGAPNGATADGLQNMRQRMEAIGGQFEIESAPQTGARIRLTFFWPAEVHL